MAKKILIVDDEQTIVFLMQTRLQASGYEVMTAYNGREGLEKAKSQKPDLIVLDVLMPQMTGYQVVENLKALGSEWGRIPVIVISAKPSMKDFFSETDIITFLPKPFDPQKLLSTVDELLKKTPAPQSSAFTTSPKETVSPKQGANSGAKVSPGAGTKSEKPFGGMKTIVIAGVDEYLVDKIKVAMEGMGFSVFIAYDEEELVEEAKNLQPSALFSQYWEDPLKLDTVKVYQKLLSSPDTKAIPFAAFCTENIGMDAYKMLKTATILTYIESSDLLKKMEVFLKEHV